jgi:hypothetical protein
VHIPATRRDYISENGEPGLNAPEVRSEGPRADAPAFLLLLARAVQQFHTYPSTSPMCEQAVEACLRALVSIDAEHVAFRVSPHELIVDEAGVGRGTLIELELARRLQAADIADVTVGRATTARELARFCADLVSAADRRLPRAGLIEVLADHGVERIALRPAYRPEVLAVKPADEPVQQLIDHERERRRQFADGPTNHLYPPGKGWIRVDPSARIGTVSLIDLALLADDPSTLAGMLMRLTDDQPSEGAPADVLSQRYSDVARLFSAMDPRVARVMFAKLARAVLDLDSEHRQALLKRTILPGLLDGRMDGAVLRDFPDLELADSLCLLLDLEAAAPEVVTAALARLELSPERQAAVIPLLEQRVQKKMDAAPQDQSVDAHARRLVRIDRERARDVAEFAAFDLALDDHARTILEQIREGIAATDTTVVQLDCLWKLTRLEPNPETVQRFLHCARPLFESIEREGRWDAFVMWMTRFRQLADTLADTRPDVADLVRGGLGGWCTPGRVSRLVALAERDEDGKATARAFVRAVGEGAAASLLAAAAQGSRGAGQVICDEAAILAPGLVVALDGADVPAQRLIARALGLAGSGCERALGTLVRSSDEHTVREALRALARLGTPDAATLVCKVIETGRGWIVAAAEQTLWHFPKPEADRQVIALLSRHDFIVKQPQTAARLIDHAPREHVNRTAVLETLQALRYRVWNPPLARVGRKARAALAQG